MRQNYFGWSEICHVEPQRASREAVSEENGMVSRYVVMLAVRIVENIKENAIMNIINSKLPFRLFLCQDVYMLSMCFREEDLIKYPSTTSFYIC
jgi:hypothetical protein